MLVSFASKDDGKLFAWEGHLDHISIPVADVARTRDFYESVLGPLGWECAGFRAGVYAAFKKHGAPALYFNPAETIGVVHLAFKAKGEKEVDAFHAAGLAAGGVDNGSPGPRPDYGENYYACFVFDPDGHNVEAVVGGVA